jgi:hypothetical protein
MKVAFLPRWDFSWLVEPIARGVRHILLLGSSLSLVIRELALPRSQDTVYLLCFLSLLFHQSLSFIRGTLFLSLSHDRHRPDKIIP